MPVHRPHRLLLVLAIGAVLAGLLPRTGSLLAPGSAIAEGNDDFSLTRADEGDGDVLIGEQLTYTLRADGTQLSEADLYNLSFRELLPAGVAFVSADPAPTAVLSDVPASGLTTVVWANVSDLPAGAASEVSITVDTNPDFAGGNSGASTLGVGSAIVGSGEAAASADPALIPEWEASTGVFTGNVDGAASAGGTVMVAPFRVAINGPNELLRGVHQNGFDVASGTAGELFTASVENNPDYTVTGATVVVTLDPGLEFLGCDSYYPTDNTTVGEEWPASGPVSSSSGPTCTPLPVSVDTNASGQTLVTWDVGDLAPGQSLDVTYQAGAPMLANAPFGAAAPPAGGLAQGRNLDNNTGPSTGETDHTAGSPPELLTSGEPEATTSARLAGRFVPTAATVIDTTTAATELEDLALTVSSTGALVPGSTVVTTLTIESSEYRDVADLVVRSIVPSALCFLGSANVDATAGGSDWATTDCPGAGATAATINGSPADAASVRELPDGGPYGDGRFEIVWDFSDVDNAALTDLDADGTLTISYTSVVRQHYRRGLASVPAEPILAGDEVTIAAEVSGPDAVADPVLPSDAVDADGGADGDVGAAELSNGFPAVDERISAKTGPLADGAGATGATCVDDHSTITWTDGGPSAEPGFGPGDVICFELGATFPAEVSYEGTAVQSILPEGFTYLPGSAARVSSIDTLDGTTVTESDNLITLTVGGGGSVGLGGNELRWVVGARLDDPADGEANDRRAGHEKLVHRNSGGEIFPQRDLAEAEWSEPEVRLASGVDRINGGALLGPDSDGSLDGNSTAVEVVAADVITYRVDVWNVGNVAALSTEVQAVLPAGFSCAEVGTISDSGGCVDGRITWTGLTVTGSTGGGDTTPDDHTTAAVTLTYDLTVPADVDPGHSWTSRAGVASYEAATNGSEPTRYYPANTIEPANAALTNTDAADDEAFAATPAAVVEGLVWSGIDEGGNRSNGALALAAEEATVGEIVAFAIELTLPEGTTVFDGLLTDTLPSGVVPFTGLGLFDSAVTDLQPSVTSPTGDGPLAAGTLVETGGVFSYELPDPYVNSAGSGDDQLTIVFYGQVADVAGNRGGSSPTRLANAASFAYDDAAGAARPEVTSAAVEVAVVEPQANVVKEHLSPVGPEPGPGSTVTYRVTATNPTSAGSVSVAHDLVIIDTVPTGITPLGPGSTVVDSDGDVVTTTGLTPTGDYTGTWSETERTITWTALDQAALDRLDPGGSVAFTYDVEVDDPVVSAGSLTNSVTLAGYSLNQDLSPLNDPRQADARSYQAEDDDTLELPKATISADLEPFADPDDDVTTRIVGQPVAYEISIQLPNGTIAYDATIFDQLPPTLDVDSIGSTTVASACETFDAATGQSTGISVSPGAVETFNPVGGDSRRLAWFVGDIYANGDCSMEVRYTAHVNSTAVADAVVANDAALAWNTSDGLTDQAPTTLAVDYDDPDSPSWGSRAGPAVESFTATEPRLDIDIDAATTTGAALTGPTCDTTAGNHRAGSDDPDGTATDGCDIAAGAELRYTVTASNGGSSAAHDLTAIATVPDGLTPRGAPGGGTVGTDGQTITGASGSAGTWSETNRTITWALSGPLDPAAVATVDYDVVLDPSEQLSRGQELTTAADVITYYGFAATERSAIVTTSPANDDLLAYGSGGPTGRGAVTVDRVTVETHFPTLAVTTAAGGGQDVTDVRLGQPSTWTVVVTNTDTVASAHDVDVTTALPQGWTYDLGSARVATPHNGGPATVEPTCSAAPIGACGEAIELNVETLTWSDLVSGQDEPLAPGDSLSIELMATPQPAALASTQAVGEAFTGYDGGDGFAHPTQASATWEDATGSTTCCDPDGAGGSPPESYGRDDDAEVHIARADLTLTKTVTPTEADTDPTNGPFWFGSYAEYTVTVENGGPDTATGVTVTEILDPTELELDSTIDVDQGTYQDTTDLWTIGTLPSGTTATLRLRTRLVGLGPVANTARTATADQYDPDSTAGNDVTGEDDQATVTIDVVPSSLGNRVWLDLDGDGIEDDGEPGIPDVELDISWADPATGAPRSRAAVTGADGFYGVPASAGLPADTDISVTVDTAASPNLAGLTASYDRDLTADGTSTEQITTADTTLPEGPLADLEFDFGYRTATPRSIDVAVWWDVDDSANATHGVDEPGLADIAITAIWDGWDGIAATADDVVYTATTLADGTVAFAGLPTGDYVVAATAADLPAGLDTPTHDPDGVATPSSTGVTIDSSVTQLDVGFSYRGEGSLGTTLWFDHDGAGDVDAGEPGISDAAITAIWDGPDGVAATADDVTLTDLTDLNGSFAFSHLPWGHYVIVVDDIALPGNTSPTFDRDGIEAGSEHRSAATLSAANPAELEHRFGYRGEGSIGGLVFYDVDGTEADGVADPGDQGLSGVDVTVVWAGANDNFGDADDFSMTTSTGSAGDHLVAGLPHGDYRVGVDEADLPAGLTTATHDADGAGTASTSSLSLSTTTASSPTQNFAYTGDPSAVIGDAVWLDVDGDGQRSATEVGFSGVTVTLTWFGPGGESGGSDDVIRSTTTGPSGGYLFEHLPNGDFTVAVDPATVPAGVAPSADADGIAASPHSSSLTVTPAALFDREQDFAYTGVGSLAGSVWFDIDHSATASAQPAEPGIPAAEVTVVWDNPQGIDATFTATTDGDGSYLVEQLPYGTHTATLGRASLPGGLRPTFDGDGVASVDVVTTQLSAATPNPTDRSFSYTGVGSIGDTIWFDADGVAGSPGTSVLDPGDQPLAGVGLTVSWDGFDEATGTADDVDYHTATGTDGEWLVSNLASGLYRVSVDPDTLPLGLFEPSYDPDGVGTRNVSWSTLDADTPDDLGQDFSYRGAGSVGDRVWFDLDADGTVDVGEVGLAGVRVILGYTGPDGSPVSASTTTDADGRYGFTDLPFDVALTLSVTAADLPSGFTPSHDPDGVASPHTSTVTLTPSAPSDGGQRFGYRGSGSLGDRVWLDRDRSGTAPADGGDVGIEGVTVVVTWDNPSVSGSDLVTGTTTGPDGAYLVSNLPDGDYTIQVDPTTLPSGVDPTVDRDGTATPHRSTTTLDGGERRDLSHGFGYAGSGSIGGRVWYDGNGDGVVDGDEAALSGMAIVLSYTDPISGFTFAERQVTEGDQTYLFEHLPAGDYELEIDRSLLPPGYSPTYDIDSAPGAAVAGSAPGPGPSASSVLDSPHLASITLTPGERRLDVDFGYRLEADLRITQTHADDFGRGAENRWSIAVSNDGPATAEQPVRVVSTLPAGVGLASTVGEAWRCETKAHTVTCTYVGVAGSTTGRPAAMEPGDSSTFDLVVTVDEGAPPQLTGAASVSSATADGDPRDDTATDAVAAPLSVLDLEKSLSERRLSVGDRATYHLVVTNHGPSPTRGEIVLVDHLPAGLTFISATDSIAAPTGVIAEGTDHSPRCSLEGASVTCRTSAVLAPTATWAVDVIVEVDGADLTGDGGGGGEARAINRAEVRGGNEVAGVAIPADVLDAIQDRLAEPGDDLGSTLGVGDIAPSTTDQVETQLSVPILAFTGSSAGLLAMAGSILTLLGLGFLVRAGRHPRRSWRYRARSR